MTKEELEFIKQNLSEIRQEIYQIRSTMERLHQLPKWKDDKMAWLKMNWMWIVIMLYVLQSMLGIETTEIIGQFAK